MLQPEPFVRESGAGPAVVCIHANASTSGQWRQLMDLLAPRHHVLAPDCYGSGKSADWPSDRVIALSDEVRFLGPVFARAGGAISLVGHSYGAAVALLAALARPGRVRSLVLYEPTLFSLIDADGPAPNEADGVRRAVADAAAALDLGDPSAAAGHFIDYWMGPGAWQATPADRKPAVAESVKNIRRWAHALLTEPTTGVAFATLRIPTLLLTGRLSTPAAHGVARRLAKLLPQCRHHEFVDLGHMGPVTHPKEVNAVIAAFLSEL
jgi:pimeloyl-ACP methyl ester carboxylesterase